MFIFERTLLLGWHGAAMNRLDLILLVDKDTAHHFHLLVFDSVLVSCSLQAF